MLKLGQLPNRANTTVLGRKATGTPNSLGRRTNVPRPNTRIPPNAQTFRSTQRPTLPKF
jgi:hypothetical protein